MPGYPSHGAKLAHDSGAIALIALDAPLNHPQYTTTLVT